MTMTFSSRFYNEAWHKWDDMKLYGSTARHTRRLIFSLLEGLSFNSVLDVGCGTGVLLQHILEQYPHTQLTGSEYSSQGIDVARARLPKARFCSMDLGLENLGRQFDLVTCIDVLEHVDDDRAALANLLAMTRKYMLLSVPLGPLFKTEARRMGHVHGYSRAELEDKIQAAGFEIVKSIQWGFPFYNIHRRFANRMPETTSMGRYDGRKKLLSDFLYALFFLNTAPGGERYYALCRRRLQVE
jgi:trans-aconitate methyltransferase